MVSLIQGHHKGTLRTEGARGVRHEPQVKVCRKTPRVIAGFSTTTTLIAGFALP